jgi:hypothetical protein
VGEDTPELEHGKRLPFGEAKVRWYREDDTG